MKIQLLLISTVLVAALSNTFVAYVPTRAKKMPVPETKLFISCPNRISGGEVGECEVGIDPASEKERTIKVHSTNTALVQLNVAEVTLAPNQYSMKVPVRTSSTPIRSTVTIKAGAEVGGHRVDAEESIEVVSALIASVKLVANSFIGTIMTASTAPTGRLRTSAEFVEMVPWPMSCINGSRLSRFGNLTSI